MRDVWQSPTIIIGFRKHDFSRFSMTRSAMISTTCLVNLFGTFSSSGFTDRRWPSARDNAQSLLEVVSDGSRARKQGKYLLDLLACPTYVSSGGRKRIQVSSRYTCSRSESCDFPGAPRHSTERSAELLSRVKFYFQV